MSLIDLEISKRITVRTVGEAAWKNAELLRAGERGIWIQSESGVKAANIFIPWTSIDYLEKAHDTGEPSF